MRTSPPRGALPQARTRRRDLRSVTNGKLVKLPALARILSPFSDPSKPLYIDSVDIKRFIITSDRFIIDDFDDMIMRSEQLKLAAKGYLTFNQIIDLYIDPEFFNVDIPGVSQLLEILQILPFKRLHLEGPLDNPETNLPAY